MTLKFSKFSSKYFSGKYDYNVLTADYLVFHSAKGIFSNNIWNAPSATLSKHFCFLFNRLGYCSKQ